MTFAYGAKSRAELEGVEPRLVRVCEIALSRSKVIDWACHDGLRMLEEQRQYVATGVSKTLNSKHLKQVDGYGHAVDLVPYVNGKLRWEPAPLYEIAALMRQAAIDEGVELTWGGVWDRQLDELAYVWRGPEPMSRALEIEVTLYRKRREQLGRTAFIDLPHFELWRG